VLSYNSHVRGNDVLVIGVEETVAIDGGDAALAGAVGAQDEAFLRAVASGEPVEPTAAGVLPVYRALQRVDDALRR
jgi:hypothetical protein